MKRCGAIPELSSGSPLRMESDRTSVGRSLIALRVRRVRIRCLDNFLSGNSRPADDGSEIRGPSGALSVPPVAPCGSSDSALVGLLVHRTLRILMRAKTSESSRRRSRHSHTIGWRRCGGRLSMSETGKTLPGECREAGGDAPRPLGARALVKSTGQALTLRLQLPRMRGVSGMAPRLIRSIIQHPNATSEFQRTT